MIIFRIKKLITKPIRQTDKTLKHQLVLITETCFYGENLK